MRTQTCGLPRKQRSQVVARNRMTSASGLTWFAREPKLICGAEGRASSQRSIDYHSSTRFRQAKRKAETAFQPDRRIPDRQIRDRASIVSARSLHYKLDAVKDALDARNQPSGHRFRHSAGASHPFRLSSSSLASRNTIRACPAGSEDKCPGSASRNRDVERSERTASAR